MLTINRTARDYVSSLTENFGIVVNDRFAITPDLSKMTATDLNSGVTFDQVDRIYVEWGVLTVSGTVTNRDGETTWHQQIAANVVLTTK